VKRIIDAILFERSRQPWSAAHDDGVRLSEWTAIVTKHLGLACADGDPDEASAGRFRREMIVIAAVCVAAIEAMDRRAIDPQAVEVVQPGRNET
jgi:hypothetical protein